MLSVDETIQNVERIYQTVTGRKAPPSESVYAPIPAEKDPVEHVEEQLNRLLHLIGESGQKMGPEAGATTPAVETPRFAPPMSVWESEGEYLFCLEVPGVTRDQVEVTLKDNILAISGQRPVTFGPDMTLRVSERPLGAFRRVIALPLGAKSGEPKAQLRDGILEIRVQKESREGAAPKTVRVN